MITITVDASISLGLVLRDEDPAAFRGLLEAAVAGDVMLVTAPHWPLEVGSGHLGAVRRKRIGMGDAERAEPTRGFSACRLSSGRTSRSRTSWLVQQPTSSVSTTQRTSR